MLKVNLLKVKGGIAGSLEGPLCTDILHIQC
jgi:hypothetical protein